MTDISQLEWLDPWAQPMKEMEAAGYNIRALPRTSEPNGTWDHLWEDGILLFWSRNKRLPLAWELQYDMFDEWDDPVGIIDCDRVLRLVCGAPL